MLHLARQSRYAKSTLKDSLVTHYSTERAAVCNKSYSSHASPISPLIGYQSPVLNTVISSYQGLSRNTNNTVTQSINLQSIVVCSVAIGDSTDFTSWLPYGAQPYLDPIHFPIDLLVNHHLNDFQAF